MPGQTRTVDVEQMIASLPRNELVLVKRLRALIIECIPQATEKAYYDLGLPFYTRNRLICFIWPPSVVWESNGKDGKRKAKGVTLGFNQGYLMSNEDGVLLSEGRKQVYAMYFKKLDDIDEAQVRALLFEAAMIDEQFAKKKKAIKRK
jgi:hypothetical protein